LVVYLNILYFGGMLSTSHVIQYGLGYMASLTALVKAMDSAFFNAKATLVCLLLQAEPHN